jgi:hypothetical protein
LAKLFYLTYGMTGGRVEADVWRMYVEFVIEMKGCLKDGVVTTWRVCDCGRWLD